MSRIARAKKAAPKLPVYMQDIAFSKAKKPRPKFGKLGAASDVRRLNPETMEVIETIVASKERRSEMRQYVRVSFGAGGKLYTYHNDGDPVEPGDKVRVESRDGCTVVEVVEVGDVAPPFATKSIGERVVET